MRLRHRQPDAGIAKINVTPLIDVIMVLIIFYLIVGKLAQDRATQVQLPVTPVGTSASNVGVVLAAQLDEGGGCSSASTAFACRSTSSNARSVPASPSLPSPAQRRPRP